MIGGSGRPGRLRLAAVLAIASTVYSGQALGKCADEWLLIDEIPEGDGVELRATNRQAYPITYAVRVRAESYPGRRGKVVRGALAGGESKRVLTVPDAGGLSLSCRWEKVA